MEYVLKAADVRAAEEKCGIKEEYLRLNAALALADALYPRASKAKRVAFFCGSGGNGADGLLAAVRLRRLGAPVEVYLADPPRTDKDLLAYVKNSGIPVAPTAKYAGGADITVDALFGIGLSRPIEGELAALIDKLNGESGFRLAVDIPSGLDADSGEILGTAFRADVTVAFSCYKPGMLTANGKDVCGKTVVRQVGLKISSDVTVYTDSDFKPVRRNPSMHKGRAGKIFVIGGCGEMVGAPLMAAAAAHAAYLNGAGTVTVCVPEICRVSLSSRVTMAMMKFMPDTADGSMKFDAAIMEEIAEKASVALIGVGMGGCPDILPMIEYLIRNFKGTLVIDADGLNALVGHTDILDGAKCKVVLTPHVGEFTRLTGCEPDMENARDFARKHGVIMTLKSATTFVTDGETVRVNTAGTPAMAKGGSGDVLAGCIAALACSFKPYDAAAVACYRNGRGAERAVSSYAELMLTPEAMLRFADYKEL